MTPQNLYKTKVSPNGLTEKITYDQTYQAFPALWKFKGLKIEFTQKI